MNKIDFVLPWVDGSDAAWIRQRNEISAEYQRWMIFRTADSVTGKTCSTGFAEWRKFAPWVNQYLFYNMGTYTFLAEYC